MLSAEEQCIAEVFLIFNCGSILQMLFNTSPAFNAVFLLVIAYFLPRSAGFNGCFALL